MTDYRLNYGNGRVSSTFTTYKTALAAFQAQIAYDWAAHQSSGARAYVVAGDAGLCLQRYEAGSADDPGCWVTLNYKERLRAAGVEL